MSFKEELFKELKIIPKIKKSDLIEEKLILLFSELKHNNFSEENWFYLQEIIDGITVLYFDKMKLKMFLKNRK
jgi:hypothetical protein